MSEVIISEISNSTFGKSRTNVGMNLCSRYGAIVGITPRRSFPAVSPFNSETASRM